MPARVLPAIERIDTTIEQMSILKKGGTEVKHTIHKALISGPVGRTIADLLHGTWLGHPLHPVLTDTVIGAWVFGTVFDVLSLTASRRREREKMQDAADTLLTLGTAMVVPTAITGLADYSAIKQEAVEYGAAHGILNGTLFVTYLLSLRARKSGNRGLGILLSSMALGVGALSAWLGGEMAFRYKVGADHAQRASKPDDWMPLLPALSLAEGERRVVELDDEKILLYRKGGQVYAIGAVCAHAGGPLEEGTFDGHQVTCPWHDSVYDVRDGGVVHGPTCYNQPNFDVRTLNGQVEIRVPQKHETEA